MLFNSTEFAVFLALVLFAYFVLIGARHPRARKGLLLVASYAFYMSWNPWFGALLAFSTGLDFALGIAIERARPPRRRLLLLVSVVSNLGLLGFFKYGGFLSQNWSVLFGLAPDAPLLAFFDVALPVGISFYTFQTLSYTLEVYWGRERACRSLADFALYVSFFPQLVAGPIVRPRDLLPQLAVPTTVAPSDWEYGSLRLALGLVKKVVFADTLGGLADRCLEAPEPVAWPILLLGVYAYAYQIYFDFSGYSDMAIGLARFFGVRLPENFDRPYLATSPREFWQRWHMSLSTWLRDYLYIPLGGSRRGVARTYVNLFLTMALGGLWHGAAWNFVLWGAYHGLLLAAHRLLFGEGGDRGARLPRMVRQIATFHLVCFGWILFRAPSLDAAIAYLAAFGGGRLFYSREVILAGLLLALAAGIHVAISSTRIREALLRAPAWLQGAGYGLAAVAVFFFSTTGQRFIYFQF